MLTKYITWPVRRIFGQFVLFSTWSSPDIKFHHPIIPLLQSLYHLKQLVIDLRVVHAYTITSSLIKDSFATSRIIQFCFKSKPNTNPPYAHLVFDSLHNPDVYTWNAMIIGSAAAPHHPSPYSPIAYYFQMLQTGLSPNSQTFAFVVKACSLMLNSTRSTTMTQDPQVMLVGIGRKMHGQIFKHGVHDFLIVTNCLLNMYCKMGLLMDAQLLFGNIRVLDLISWNTMITAYGRHGQVGVARKLFDEMPHRSLVSWSAMIDAYITSGEFAEPLRLFKQMQDSSSGLRPDAIILVSVLKACANLGALDLGKRVHLYIDENKLSWDNNVVLGTALIDMYAKCGCIDVALELFTRMRDKDLVLWNAIIGGLATHGHGRDALQLFSNMRQLGTAPNSSTFLMVLCACVHSGMVTEGVEIFEAMKKDYGIEPGVEHYGCLADILGKAGLVHEAEQVLCNMPMEPQASQWGALMAACRTTNNVEVGERVGKRIISLEPHDGGRYVLLSNLYAGAGRWEDVRKIRREMYERGAKKETAHSFIEQDGIVHEFIAGDKAHSRSRDIYELLDELKRELELVGFAQGTSQLNDLDNY